MRSHASPEPYTLADYRARHALYRSDPDLQAGHAACPWIATWDDHEVDNDYADDRPEDGMEREAFLERRAAAYRAYFEHMPLPPSMRPEGRMRIHTQLDWGALARYIVDTRQYRSWQACPRPAARRLEHRRHRGMPAPRYAGTLHARPAQERWLERSLAESRGMERRRPDHADGAIRHQARARPARGPTGGTGIPPRAGASWKI